MYVLPTYLPRDKLRDKLRLCAALRAANAAADGRFSKLGFLVEDEEAPMSRLFRDFLLKLATRLGGGIVLVLVPVSVPVPPPLVEAPTVAAAAAVVRVPLLFFRMRLLIVPRRLPRMLRTLLTLPTLALSSN